jgi:hypothetical protein
VVILSDLIPVNLPDIGYLPGACVFRSKWPSIPEHPGAGLISILGIPHGPII